MLRATTYTHERLKCFTLYASMGIMVLVIGILPISSVIPLKLIVNLLFLALALFALGFWREYRVLARDLRSVWVMITCLLVIIIMAYISLHWAVDTKATRQAIRQYLLEPGLFMLLAFLVSKRLDDRGLWLLLIGLILALYYHPVATIWDFFSSPEFANQGFAIIGRYRAMLPNYHAPATVYVFYLLFSLGLSLSIAIFMRGVWRILGLCFVLLCIIAFIANGGRFGMLAMCGIFIAPSIFCSYKYKKYILLGVIVIACIATFAIYSLSEKWNSRYNFHHMAQNFSLVWQSNPAEMGKFTSCNPSFCSPYSLGQTSPVQWEYSSLARISMAKTTLLAIAQNPLRPNGYHFQQFPQNILKFFLPDSPYYTFTYNWHAHNHNYFLSTWFELGAIGFCAFGGFVLFFLVGLYRLKPYCFQSNSSSTILSCGIGFSLLGLLICNIFDCIPVRDGQIALFILLGIMAGILSNISKIRKFHAEDKNLL